MHCTLRIRVLGLARAMLALVLVAEGVFGPLEARADDGLEPPANPFLADSAWPMTHRNPYNQASSPLAAPRSANVRVDSTAQWPGAITLVYEPSAAGRPASMWGRSGLSVFRLDSEDEGLSYRDSLRAGLAPGGGISGAYTLLDREGTFFVPHGTSIVAYRAEPELERVRSLELPAHVLGAEGDLIVGLNLTYDGMLAFATRHGVVGILSRDFRELHTLWLGEGHVVSNSIATDEQLGIYVVTSRRMFRVAWTGSELSLDAAAGAWEAAYETGSDTPVTGRLGAGSGSTPTLMGTGDMDRFVVITDGRPLMHLVLFWRDQVPADFQPIAPGKDRRIAAEVPIRFGDPSAETSVSEQSVLVRGYGAMVVNNDYGISLPSALPDVVGNLITVSVTNLPGIAPHGAEKLEWDPATRTLRSVWVNRKVSCPSGIPTMSAATGLAYCIGQRYGVWTLEALDWHTGASRFHRYLGIRPRYNSAYAGTEIGPSGEIVTGTLTGIVRIGP